MSDAAKKALDEPPGANERASAEPRTDDARRADTAQRPRPRMRRTSSSSDRPRESGEPAPGTPRDRLSARVNFWSTIVTAIAAAAALTLSLVTYAQVNSRAEVSLVMPKLIRIWSDQGYVKLDMGFTFTVDKRTDVAAMVLDSQLTMDPPEGSSRESLRLPWTEVVEFEYPSGPAPTRTWIDDPSPFLVTQGTAEHRIMEYTVFGGPDDIALRPGRWTVDLVVYRHDQRPLTHRFCLDLSPDLTESINGAQKEEVTFSGFWHLRHTKAQLPEEPEDSGTPECYAFL